MKGKIANLPPKGVKGFVAIPIESRFWSKVNKTQNCWLWIASLNEDGYGIVKFNGRMHGAHRVCYELFVGEIADGKHVLHKCDVRNCVKPDHLWLGTHTENIRDMFQKGRGNPGGHK